MNLNELKRAPGSRQTRKRVGRGMSAGQGKTCGRGHKGQRSRSGAGIPLGFEGGQLPLQQRIPTFGFRSRIGRVTDEIRLHELNKVDGDVVDIASLRSAGLISSNIKRVRIMHSGSIEKAVTVKGIRVSKGARTAIEAAGGSIEE